MSDNKRQEMNMLWMHCKNDSAYLQYILEDYLRLKDEHEEWIRRSTTALKKCDEIMRCLWKERCDKMEVPE